MEKLNHKQIKVPAKLHTAISYIANRDRLPMWRVIAEAVSDHAAKYPEPRTIKCPELRGRPKKLKEGTISLEK